MSVRKVGFKGIQRLLNEIPETMQKNLAQANEDNARAVISVAKVLVPVGKTARSKAAIKAEPQANGGQIMDFGPLSSILEGGTAERQHKTGKSTGKGSKRAFVNPALIATEKQRAARYRKAARDAIKEAKGGGNA